jgi:ketosteroid isomerase-like protein
MITMIKDTFFTLLAAVALIGCNGQPADHSLTAAMEIMQADKDMCALAVQEGFNKALLSYADDSLVKPEEGKFPILGKQALEKLWGDEAGSKSITWTPYRAEASVSGELGYTLGNWKMITPDTTYYGHYYTIWKKHPDGTWKWAVDGGNNTPSPE